LRRRSQGPAAAVGCGGEDRARSGLLRRRIQGPAEAAGRTWARVGGGQPSVRGQGGRQTGARGRGRAADSRRTIDERRWHTKI
jgi:hypothetical protein